MSRRKSYHVQPSAAPRSQRTRTGTRWIVISSVTGMEYERPTLERARKTQEIYSRYFTSERPFRIVQRTITDVRVKLEKPVIYVKGPKGEKRA